MILLCPWCSELIASGMPRRNGFAWYQAFGKLRLHALLAHGRTEVAWEDVEPGIRELELIEEAQHA